MLSGIDSAVEANLYFQLSAGLPLRQFRNIAVLYIMRISLAQLKSL